jgi:colanic acid/amylovoran biosynthesis glycosyltransferase
MPTTTQEAMSSGRVVISTNHTGIPEHIENNINGLIVDERDLNAYTEAIISVQENDT